MPPHAITATAATASPTPVRESGRSPCLLHTDTCNLRRPTGRTVHEAHPPAASVAATNKRRSAQWHERAVAQTSAQHLEIVSSLELFARRLPSSADTLLSVSTSRRCSCDALLQLQLQLTALGVLQLQHADTPEFVSACSGGLQRSPSEHGDDFRKSGFATRRAITSAPRSCSGDA